MFIPQPDLALLLDADPEAATLRKPEYPLAFVRQNRETYMRLGRMVGMTVVPPLPIQQASEVIRDAVAEKCGEGDVAPVEVEVEFPTTADSAKASSSQKVSTSC
jgi:hypothetical protein